MEKETKNIKIIKDLDKLQRVWQHKLKGAEDVEKDDLENDFLDWQIYLYDRATLYGIDRFNYKYYKPFYSSWGTLRWHFYPLLSMVDLVLTKYIDKRGLDKADVPLIPICEYKLVPTGRVIIRNIKKCKDYQEIKERYKEQPTPTVYYIRDKSKALADMWQLKQNTVAEYYENYQVLNENEYEKFIPKNTRRIYTLPTEYMLKHMRNGYYDSVEAARRAAALLCGKYGVDRKYIFILEYYLVYTGDFEVYDPTLTPSARREYRRNRTEKGRARVWRGHQKRKEKAMAEKALKEKENESKKDT